MTPYRFAAAVLAFFAFFMAALISRTVFERMPHLEDEVAYLYQAKLMARGDLTIDSPTPRRAFWQPFVVDFQGQRFGKYTLGYPAVLTLGLWLGQAWVMNAFFAALNVALTYRIGRELFNEDAGLMGAALTAFSPMALLLNATMMAHTPALTFALLFFFAYLRLTRRRGGRALLAWGVVAGLALGVVVTMRPFTAIAVALPFILWSLVRLAGALRRDLQTPPDAAPRLPETRRTLTPLLALSACTLLLSATIPLFNHAATGDASRNLYTLVWEYDRVGFGQGYGRAVHSIERGIKNLRFDMSLFAADLFGWQWGTFTPELQSYAGRMGSWWTVPGVSWALLPLAALVGFGRQKRLGWLWLAAVLAWFLFTHLLDVTLPESRTLRVLSLNVTLPDFVPTLLLSQPEFSWFWIIFTVGLLMLPVVFVRETAARGTWLAFAIPLTLIVLQLAYWIGSQIYSTRYFFEGLPALALASALPLAWVANGLTWGGTPRLDPRIARTFVYTLLGCALLFSLYLYSTPRIEALRGYNYMSRDVLDGIEARRDGSGRPVLVIVRGPDSGDNLVRWRALGELMFVTSPYFDSDIVGAWAWNDDTEAALLALFPDRQVIYMDAVGNLASFRDQQ